MSLRRSSALRWGVFFLCLVMGTWFGLFMQRFGVTSAIFSNFVDFTIDISQVDIGMLKLGFLFALRLNAGTIIGGIAGMFIAR